MEKNNIHTNENEMEMQNEIKKLSGNEISEMMFSETEPLSIDNHIEDDAISYEKDTAILSSINGDKTKYPSLDNNNSISGKRKSINYGGESRVAKLERIYRAFESAKSNRKILEGIIISARMVPLPNHMEDVLFEVAPTDPVYGDISVYITGENMSKVLAWNKQESTKGQTIDMRKRFAKGMIFSEIQFCIENITITNPKEKNIEQREYFMAGNRVMANEMIKEMYFDSHNPDSLQEGDIVNGRVIAVFANRLVYSVAGIDMYLYTTIPYITGASRILPGSSGKQLVQINEDKECLINQISRNPETNEVTNLRISFYAPLKEKIIKKIDAMNINALYSGTIMRFLPPKENGKSAYMIVKTDSGIEVLCMLPNWKKPPMEMDSVKVKIIDIRPNGEETLVLGFIKR